MAKGHWSGNIWSTTLQHSYTPPTCRLTVVGRRSLLAPRQRPRLSNVRFELLLDDPRLRDEERKVVRGDQAQLFHLSESVRCYVHEFLSQSSQYLVALSNPALSSHGSAAHRSSPRHHSANQGAIAALPRTRATTYVEPQGLAAHNLVLGTLATADSGAVIQLGTLQLFDVLSALEAFLADWQSWATPAPGGDRLPPWLSPLVGVVVTGGLVAALSPLVENPSPEESSTSPDPPSSNGIASNGIASNGIASVLGVFSQTSIGVFASEALAPPESDATPIPPPVLTDLPPLSSSMAPPPSRVTPLDIDPSAQPPMPSPPNSPTDSPSASSSDLTRPHSPDLLFEQPLSGPEAAPSPDLSQFPQPEPFAPLTRPIPVGEDQETAFDFVPQVTELRRYFQQRWTPPEGLNQSLEYTLVMNESGTLTQVFPLGRSAVQFQDHSQIPEVGEPLLSPHDSPLHLRLVLGQQGEVNVFVQ